MGTINNYYCSSQRVNFPGMIISYAVGIIIAFFGGYLYTSAIHIIPVIYLNIITVLGLALLLYYTVITLGKLTHNRNKTSLFIQLFILSLIAYMVQWDFTILHAFSGEFPTPGDFFSTFALIMNPSFFFAALKEINQSGLWGFSNDTMVTGWPLTIIWIVEGLLIIGLPLLFLKNKHLPPYSELLSKWYSKYILRQDFSGSIEYAMKDTAIEDLPKLLLNAEKGAADRYSKIYIYYEEQEDNQYLTVEKISINSKNNTKKEITIENLCIPKGVAETILQNSIHQKEKHIAHLLN